MAKLAIYKHGELTQTLEMKAGEEYLVGRSDDCQAVLSGGTGISRHHFKVFHDGVQWQVELLSKFGNLSYKGGRADHIPLVHGESFSIPPFEFSFIEEQTKKTSMPAVHDQDYLQNEPTVDQDAHDLSASLTDRTALGISHEKPYLKIHNTITKSEENLRLEGSVWIAGRDASCEIVLKDRGASRHHFELSQAADGFYIRDLNSANGTMVNGTQILPDQPVPVKSGDIISVLSLNISFQMRDPNFNQKIGLVPAAMMEPMHAGLPQFYGWQNLPQDYQPGGAVSTGEAEEPKKKFDFKKHRIKIAAGAILLLAVWIGFSEPPKNGKKRDPSNVPEIFENLPKEQQQVIKNSYNIAKEQLIAKRCELALPELRRIHELVPFYQDSKTIESDCQQQIETIKIYEELQERKKQERETLRLVEAAVARCEAEMTETTTIEDVNLCLGDEGSLIPEHPGVQRLKALIEEREIEKERKLQAQQDYDRRVKRGVRLYNAAATLEEKGEDYNAIKAYKKFLGAGMPDPNGLKPKAERSIASLGESMSSKINKIIDEARELVEQMQFNKAMYLLHRGDKINPTSEKVKEARKEFEQRNDKEMRLIYTDSVLEENLGNIESAKDRWRKIIEISYTGSEYYKKAKSKLSKYGGE